MMDAVSDPSVEKVVVMKSSQTGWTEILNNVAAYYIDRDPSPILLIQPTVEMAEAWSKDRLAPMIRDTPALRSKIADPRARDSGNSLLHKVFAGGHITMAGANSPAGLASRPIRVLLFDEVDRYPVSAGTEGDPINLATKRTTTFWNRKILMGSTPTIKGHSRIELAFGESDQRYYMVPCPHCHHEQRLMWDSVKWPDDDPSAAYLTCVECGSVINDADKLGMLEKGRWVATQPFKGTAGFHISELYSPWVSFGKMAEEFVLAKRTPQTLQTWINTALGEVWVEKGSAPEWGRVLEQRADYDSGSVPDWVFALVAGVDVQKNRLVYVIRGFGADMASALIENGELYGDTDQPEVWLRLGNLLSDRWGNELAIKRMFVDSGYRASQVYEFARRFNHQACATKGHDKLSAPIKVAKIDVTTRGGVAAHGLQLYHLDASYFKSWVHSRIEWPTGEPGAWLLPADVSDEYCKQVVAESQITLPSGAVVWKKHRPDNHYLDAEAMAAAAAHSLQIHRMKVKPATPKQDGSNSANPWMALNS